MNSTRRKPTTKRVGDALVISVCGNLPSTSSHNCNFSSLYVKVSTRTVRSYESTVVLERTFSSTRHFQSKNICFELESNHIGIVCCHLYSFLLLDENSGEVLDL